MLYSFELFDTLIARKTWTQKGIFKILQVRLNVIVDKEDSDALKNFVTLRENAEGIARKCAAARGDEETTLEEIYSILEDCNPVSKETCDRIRNEEIAINCDTTYVIKENVEIVKKLICAGERVVIVSDTVLSKTVIRDLLTMVDPILSQIEMYLSSELKATQKTGKIYEIIRENEHVHYCEWNHYSSRKYLEDSIPIRLGIHTISTPIIKTDLFRDSEDLFYDIYKGLINKCLMEHDELDYMAVYGVPILFSYINWILRVCIYKKIKRLYFMARDGYVLKIIADILIRNQKLAITTVYLYGSRKSLRCDRNDKFELARNYLIQEMDLRDNKYAIIDTNSTGISMSYVSRMLGNDNNNPLNVFYFYLDSKVDDPSCTNHVFSDFSNINMSSNVIELFCRAPHASTVSYRINNDRIDPVFSENHYLESYLDKLDQYYRSIEDLTTRLLSYIPKIDIGESTSCETAEISINTIGTYEDYMLNEYIGDLLHSDDSDDGKYAPPFTKNNTHELYMMQQYGELYSFYGGSNYELSLKRTAPEVIETMQKNLNAGKYDNYYLINLRIIIYGAGKIGEKMYKMISYETNSKVIGWTDLRYNFISDTEMPLIDIDKCLEMKFDYIIISVRKEQDAIRDMIHNKGVNKCKIITYSEFIKKMLDQVI